MSGKQHEASEVLSEFAKMLAGPTNDGQRKRANGKVFWKDDPDHLNALHRHLHRYDRGELHDQDSGTHPLVHVAWRALARAAQEMNQGKEGWIVLKDVQQVRRD